MDTNVKIEVTGDEVTIRTGAALPLKEPVKIEITGYNQCAARLDEVSRSQRRFPRACRRRKSDHYAHRRPQERVCIKSLW